MGSGRGCRETGVREIVWEERGIRQGRMGDWAVAQLGPGE